MLTEEDGHLLVGSRERVPLGTLGEDDERTVEVDAQPGEVRVPPQRPALPRHGEVVHVALPALDRALRDVQRPVRPPVAQLPDAVPAFIRSSRHTQVSHRRRRMLGEYRAPIDDRPRCLVFVLPVEGDIVVDVVVDLDHEAVAFPRGQLRPRELPVHRRDALRHAQPRHVRHPHLRTNQNHMHG